jgi:hypothetical protein
MRAAWRGDSVEMDGMTCGFGSGVCGGMSCARQHPPARVLLLACWVGSLGEMVTVTRWMSGRRTIVSSARVEFQSVPFYALWVCSRSSVNAHAHGPVGPPPPPASLPPGHAPGRASGSLSLSLSLCRVRHARAEICAMLRSGAEQRFPRAHKSHNDLWLGAAPHSDSLHRPHQPHSLKVHVARTSTFTPRVL